MNNIKKLRKFFRSFMIDGYLVPKNDEYFNEYVSQSSDRLKFISNFSGSAGFAIILKNKNYVFAHAAKYQLPDKKILIGCYHPSPRNVNTKRINLSKMVKLFKNAKKIII